MSDRVEGRLRLVDTERTATYWNLEHWNGAGYWTQGSQESVSLNELGSLCESARDEAPVENAASKTIRPSRFGFESMNLTAVVLLW